jgi:hypothetical protein
LQYAQNYLDYTAVYLAEDGGAAQVEKMPDLGVAS